MPNIPGLPKVKEASPPATVKQDIAAKTEEGKTLKADENQGESSETAPIEAEKSQETTAPKPAPKSWADLVRQKSKPGAAAAPTNGEIIADGIQLVPKSASLADALKQYNVRSGVQLPFLEPRGLVNTGNMCYMNSVSIWTTF